MSDIRFDCMCCSRTYDNVKQINHLSIHFCGTEFYITEITFFQFWASINCSSNVSKYLQYSIKTIPTQGIVHCTCHGLLHTSLSPRLFCATSLVFITWLRQVLLVRQNQERNTITIKTYVKAPWNSLHESSILKAVYDVNQSFGSLEIMFLATNY